MCEEVLTEFLFVDYLLEMYATYRGITAGEAVKDWDRYGITQQIYDNYWIYHTERIENTYTDIDRLIKTKM